MKHLTIAGFVLAFLLAPSVARADDLLGYGDDGLWLGEQPLFAGPVSGAAYDAAQELVWFRTGGTLEVIDLRDPKLAAVKIVSKLPADGAFAIAGASTAGFLTGADEWVVSYPVLQTGKKSKLKSTQSGDFGDNGGDDRARAKKIKKAKIVGAKWLKALAKRKPREVPATAVNAAAERVEPPTPDACEEPDECGGATTLGNSRYRIVVTAFSYGAGFAEKACHLYDSEKQRFASPNTTGTWKDDEPVAGPCNGYGLSADGTRYFVGDVICTPGAKGIDCTEPSGRWYLGWR
jgi:hypothetical protein